MTCYSLCCIKAAHSLSCVPSCVVCGNASAMKDSALPPTNQKGKQHTQHLLKEQLEQFPNADHDAPPVGLASVSGITKKGF